MARAELALQHRPKQPILNLGLLCCCKGAVTFVDILASTSLFARGFVALNGNFMFDTMHGNIDQFDMMHWHRKLDRVQIHYFRSSPRRSIGGAAHWHRGGGGGGGGGAAAARQLSEVEVKEALTSLNVFTQWILASAVRAAWRRRRRRSRAQAFHLQVLLPPSSLSHPIHLFILSIPSSRSPAVPSLWAADRRRCHAEVPAARSPQK